MLKRLALTLGLFTLITLLLIACSERTSTAPPPNASATASNSGTPSSEGTTIQMQNESFSQGTITIKKGESVTLVNASVEAHIVENGTWENNAPKKVLEEGAPEISFVSSEKDSTGTIGPFNTAGTFHIYCVVHPGMNLTVTVQ